MCALAHPASNDVVLIAVHLSPLPRMAHTKVVRKLVQKNLVCDYPLCCGVSMPQLGAPPHHRTSTNGATELTFPAQIHVVVRKVVPLQICSLTGCIDDVEETTFVRLFGHVDCQRDNVHCVDPRSVV